MLLLINMSSMFHVPSLPEAAAAAAADVTAPFATQAFASYGGWLFNLGYIGEGLSVLRFFLSGGVMYLPRRWVPE